MAIDQTVTGADGTKYRLQGTLTVTVTAPTPNPTPLTISGVSVNPTSVLAGQPTTGTITMSRAPEQAIVVMLQAVDGGGLTLPSTLTIPAGKTTGTVTIGTPATVVADKYFSFRASYYSQIKDASVLVRANTPPPAPPQLTGWSFPDTPVYAGQSATGTLTLETAPTAPVVVSLTSSSDELIVPPTVTIPAGSRVTPVPISTPARMSDNQSFTVTATLGDVTLSGGFRVWASPPPVGGSPLIERVRMADGSPIYWPLPGDAPPKFVPRSANPAAAPGMKVVGRGFGTAKGRLIVNSYAQAVTAWSDTEITFVPDLAALGGSPGWVMVERPDGRYYSGLFLHDGGPPVPEPVLTRAPYYNPQGQIVTKGREGDVFTVRAQPGETFGGKGMVIYAGSFAAPLQAWSDTEISFKLPFTWWDEHLSEVWVYSGAPYGKTPRIIHPSEVVESPQPRPEVSPGPERLRRNLEALP